MKILTGHKLTALFGVICLIYGVLTPWFTVPEKASIGMEVAGQYYFALPSIFQLPFQLVSFATALTVIVLLYKRKEAKWLAWTGFAATLLFLFFPYFVMNWDPDTALRAHKLLSQSKHLVDELQLNFPEQMTGWKQEVSMHFVYDQYDLFHPWINNIQYLSIANVRLWINDFGFNVPFLQFAKIGYPAAIVGGLLLVISSFLRRDIARFPIMIRQIKVMAAVSTFAVIIAAIPIFTVHYLMHRAHVMALQGLYPDALRTYRLAESIAPILDLDSNFHNHIGRVFYYSKHQGEADYYVFLGSRQMGQMLINEALTSFNEALRIRPDHPVALNKRSLALINLGALQYEQASYDSAIEAWKKVIDSDPSNLTALFELQLGYMRISDFESIVPLARRVMAIKYYFQVPSLTILGQSYVHLAWSAYKRGNFGQALDYYHKSIAPNLW